MEEARVGVNCEKDSLAETGQVHNHVNNRLNEKALGGDANTARWL